MGRIDENNFSYRYPVFLSLRFIIYTKDYLREQTTIDTKARIRYLFVIVGIMLQRNWLQPAYKTVIFATIKKLLLNVLLVNFCYRSSGNYKFDRMVRDALSCFVAGAS